MGILWIMKVVRVSVEGCGVGVVGGRGSKEWWGGCDEVGGAVSVAMKMANVCHGQLLR